LLRAGGSFVEEVGSGATVTTGTAAIVRPNASTLKINQAAMLW
jgi:hypothetical protein